VLQIGKEYSNILQTIKGRKKEGRKKEGRKEG